RHHQLAEDFLDDVLVSAPTVGRDEFRRPPSQAALDVLQEHPLDVAQVLADLDAEHQTAIRVKGHVVPLLTLGDVILVQQYVAMLLLLGDEGPFLIQLDLLRRGGKSPPIRRGRPGHVRPPCASIVSPYSDRRRSGGRWLAPHNRRRYAPALPRPCLGSAWSCKAACRGRPRSAYRRSGSRASGGRCSCHSGHAPRCCLARAGRTGGSLGSGSRTGSARGQTWLIPTRAR